MAIVDRRTVGSRFTVRENADRLANYRYAETEIMQMIGGWSITVVEMPVKINFGYQMWEQAQTVDALGKRMAEMQMNPKKTHAPNEDFVRLCEEIWKVPDTLRRLVAVYRVLKPHLLSHYIYHLEATDSLADNPTQRILEPIIDRTKAHIEWGQGMIEKLADSPPKRRSALEWQAHVEEALVKAGGVTGRGADAHWLPYSDVEDESEKQGHADPWHKVNYSFSKKLPFIKAPARDHRWKVVAVHELPPAAPFTDQAGRVYTLHTLLNNEIVTVERMGKMLAEFPELPWEMQMDLAHQAWDEARHAEIVATRIEELGGYIGQHPVYFFSWEYNENHPDPLARIAYGNRLSEHVACGRLKEWKDEAEKAGDRKTAEALDYILADEIVHAKYGRDWIDILTKNDSARKKSVIAYAENLARMRAEASKWFSPEHGAQEVSKVIPEGEY
jgi:uncharacterized ferritin-like protein (DUF455 family)